MYCRIISENSWILYIHLMVLYTGFTYTIRVQVLPTRFIYLLCTSVLCCIPVLLICNVILIEVLKYCLVVFKTVTAICKRSLTLCHSLIDLKT